MTRRIIGASLIAAFAVLPIVESAIHAYSAFAKWTTLPVIFYLNPQYSTLTLTATENAALFAANVWNSQTGTVFRYQYGGRVSDTSIANDGRNVVIFRSDSNGSTIGTTYSYWSDGSLLDSDVVFWSGGFSFFTGTSGCSGSDGVYLEDVMTHELGHALGLDHSTDPTATMYPSYSICSQALRDLAPDDIAAAQSLYSPSASTTSSTSSSTQAYGGTPAAIPGTIEAENFDEGGQSVAYYDTTTGNKGASYRSTDVDIGATADGGGGYYIGWTRPGEWLAYTVNIAAARTYTLKTRVANVGTGATFHLEVDGVNATGAIAVPDTGAWDAWQSLLTPGISLLAGQHVIHVVLDTMGSGGAVGGFNWFRFFTDTSSSPTTAYGGTPAAIPGRIEAENFDVGDQSVAYYDTTAGNKGGSYRTTDVDIGPSTDGDGGYYIGWTRAGEWLTYTVNVAATGTYTLSTRVANVGTGATFHVEVDGVNSTGSIAVPDTGAWDAWQTITTSTISISAGPHILRVVLDTLGSGGAVGGFNWFALSGS
jgi:hypothetical protein